MALANVMGWLGFGVLAFCGLVLIGGAIADSIRAWRWKRAWSRGEIPKPTRAKAAY